jgi:hypothetical protein
VAAEVTIENSLAQCIALTAAQPVRQGAGLYLPTVWAVSKVTGECGCKSALVSYRVTAGSRDEVIATGVLSSLNKKSFAFLINPDASIRYDDRYELFVGCAN